MKHYQSVLFLPLFLIAACTSEKENPTPEPSVIENAMQDQKRALEKAKQVDQMVQDRFEKQRQMIDKNSQ